MYRKLQRNGEIYAQEFGWDHTYEALVARIVADYIDGRDPDMENAWIAEVDGEPVLKISGTPAKTTSPGRKQVWRTEEALAPLAGRRSKRRVRAPTVRSARN
jgi:hypothetical protein